MVTKTQTLKLGILAVVMSFVAVICASEPAKPKTWRQSATESAMSYVPSWFTADAVKSFTKTVKSMPSSLWNFAKSLPPSVKDKLDETYAFFKALNLPGATETTKAFLGGLSKAGGSMKGAYSAALKSVEKYAQEHPAVTEGIQGIKPMIAFAASLASGLIAGTLIGGKPEGFPEATAAREHIAEAMFLLTTSIALFICQKLFGAFDYYAVPVSQTSPLPSQKTA